MGKGVDPKVSSAAADVREPRHFDVEADRRARRSFGLLVIAFALLAILGGIFAAWLLLDDDPPPQIIATKPKPPEAIEEHPPLEPFTEAPPPVEAKVRVAAKLADTIGDGDLRRMLAKLQGAFDACARKHGAVDGTIVDLDFSIAESGRVDESAARPPFGSTPLGQCIAGVVRDKAVFAKTRNGRRDIRWSIHLRP
jgi:hypothetical protein